MTYTTKEMTTEVLIIGGGIAAIFAAKRAVKNGAKVIMVDKGSVGRSGLSPFASAMAVFDEEAGDDRNTWHADMAETGENLNNPAYLDNFMDYSKEIYQEMSDWGATEIGFGGVLRSQLMKMDLEIIERTMITDLIEEGGTVCGAVGFGLDDGEALVIKAKSVIMCTGAGGFKPSGFQVCSLSFDGDAMAYRIGAKISGKEFMDAHTSDDETPAYCWGQWQGMWAQGMPALYEGPDPDGMDALNLDLYHNAHEGIFGMTRPEGGPGDGPPEGSEGDGPPGGGEGQGPGQGENGESDRTGPGEGNRPSDGEGGPGEMGGGMPTNPIGGASAGLGVHKAEGLFPVDGRCATNIKGLYAAGDCLSSMLVGPTYSGVGGFAFGGSATQGALAGEVAADYIKSSIQIQVSDTKVDQLIEDMFLPMTKEQGYGPGWVEHMLQGTLIPYYVLFIKHEERLKSALTSIEFYRDNFQEKMMAQDLHDLRKAHEVKNMLLNAEMKLKASLFRTESRGNHYREDYPDRNDDEWLAWTVIHRDEQGTMALDKFYVKDFE